MLRAKLGSGENEKMLQIGREALDKIPYTYTVRGEIALLTAEYACKLQDKAAMEACWLEAFRSNSTVVNYLRIRMQTENWAKYKDAVRTIYVQFYEELREKRKRGRIVYDMNHQGEKSLSEEEYCLISFFDEQFEKMIEMGMTEKGSLGWSSTFMEQGIALFLLLLYNAHDDRELPAGLRGMLRRAIGACKFKAEEYFWGTGVQNNMGDFDAFWKMFCKWKENAQISEAQKNEWFDKIDEWAKLGVIGTMDGKKRTYYGDCPSYIAALNEVQESVGIPGIKEHIVARYRSGYSRRRAFYQELRRYGMKKGR
jgi:hypothetical protein